LRVCSIAQPMPEELAYFSVDQRVGRPGHDATFSIGGVAILNRTAKESYSLVVCDSNGEHPVSWGLPSPAVAKKYHGSPGAGTSRFKIEGLRLGKGDNAKLLLVRADGERDCLATLALHEHKDINS
jgi:hypothetical protein